MAPCTSRFSCTNFFTADSPTKPYRQPRYTLSRVPSLDAFEPSLAELRQSSEQSNKGSKSSTSSAQTVLHKQAWAGPRGIKPSETTPIFSTSTRGSSFQALLQRACTAVMRRDSTASPANLRESDVASARTVTPSLRRRNDVSDLRDEYKLPAVNFGRGRSNRNSAIVSEDGDSEWMTDDEGEEGENKAAGR